ncbi:MAG TPA: deoxyribonuclease V, partial [Dehalococcoidales bacterium]|nr:deoxyribonuclease V [Dehalococcoidales bacterium]
QGEATAAVVVMTYPGLEEIEVSRENGAVTFPYVPGLLSFRKIPLLVEAFQKLKNIPDLVLVDGQGIAHPRRMGIATHLGILLELPTIGCAKSRLIGEYTEPGPEAGCHTNLMDNNEIIGAVVRTRTNTKPVYVSIGHKIDLTSAIQLTLSCCAGYRIPEPTRRAHLWANKKIEPVGVLN